VAAVEAPAPAPAPAASAEAAPVAEVPAPVQEPESTPTEPAPAPKAAAPRPAPRPRNAAPAREVKAPAAAAPVANGLVQLAISPWGQVEVDGRAAGTTPPLARLTLAEGQHTITVRNDDFPAYTVTVQVSEDKPVTVRYRFGSGS